MSKFLTAVVGVAALAAPQLANARDVRPAALNIAHSSQMTLANVADQIAPARARIAKKHDFVGLSAGVIALITVTVAVVVTVAVTSSGNSPS